MKLRRVTATRVYFTRQQQTLVNFLKKKFMYTWLNVETKNWEDSEMAAPFVSIFIDGNDVKTRARDYLNMLSTSTSNIDTNFPNTSKST